MVCRLKSLADLIRSFTNTLLRVAQWVFGVRTGAEFWSDLWNYELECLLVKTGAIYIRPVIYFYGRKSLFGLL